MTRTAAPQVTSGDADRAQKGTRPSSPQFVADLTERWHSPDGIKASGSSPAMVTLAVRGREIREPTNLTPEGR